MKLNPEIDGAEFVLLTKTTILPLTGEQIWAHVRAVMRQNVLISEDEALRQVREATKREEQAECWASHQYTVLVYRDTRVGDGWPAMDWLSIRRDDREPVRDWRHMQAIKNQICGPDREGLELYPAEARLVDTANQFHIWVLRQPGHLPFGFFEGRKVESRTEPGSGAVQRERSDA